jgi:hypothetical protein
MADFNPNPRSAPSVISGNRGPEQVTSTRVIADVQDEILLYQPSAAPLTVLTGKFRKKRTVTQSKFDVLTQDEYPRSLKLTTAAPIADVTLDVEAGTGVRAAQNYTYINTRTRETVLVSSIATDTLTVVRAIGSTQQDMEIGDTLVFLRPVAEDGADIGTLKTVKEDADFNYTEIIRTPFGFTGRQQNTSMYGGKDPALIRKVMGIEHKKSIEQMMFFGTRHKITGTHEQTFSGGLEYFIRSNVWNLGGVEPTERSWVEFLEEAMRWGDGGSQNGNGVKYFFVSDRWATVLEFFAKNKLEYRPLDKQIGLKAAEYVTTHGTIMIVKTPILNYNHPDTGFIVDLNHVRYVRHQGRDTKLLDKRQGNGVDGAQEEYLSDVGCQVELEASHAVVKGLPL